MGNAGRVPLILYGALCLIGVATAVLFGDSSGGFVGYDTNYYCYLKNYEGQVEFYRRIDGRIETISSSSRHLVFRCNKTTSDVIAEDSVLTISNALESDSGTYGCVLKFKGQLNWEVKTETNITVKPVPVACSDCRKSATIAIAMAKRNQGSEQGQNDEKPTTMEDKDEGSHSKGLLAAVIVLSIVVVVLVVALLWRHRTGAIPADGSNGGLNDTNYTVASAVEEHDDQV